MAHFVSNVMKRVCMAADVLTHFYAEPSALSFPHGFHTESLFNYSLCSQGVVLKYSDTDVIFQLKPNIWLQV